jgi:protein gp37
MTTLIPRSVAAGRTGIGWADFSNNGWTVCSEIPAAPGAKSGCEICYARGFAKRLGLQWGPHIPRHKFDGAAARARQLDRLAAAAERKAA